VMLLKYKALNLISNYIPSYRVKMPSKKLYLLGKKCGALKFQA
jgi:hypothetical protein